MDAFDSAEAFTLRAEGPWAKVASSPKGVLHGNKYWPRRVFGLRRKKVKDEWVYCNTSNALALIVDAWQYSSGATISRRHLLAAEKAICKVVKTLLTAKAHWEICGERVFSVDGHAMER